jgi:DNA gyrase subunit A
MKRMALSEFKNVRVSGLIAINLEEGDELGWARLTSGQDDVIMVTAGGYGKRTKETDFRPMGRSAKGVTGIKLEKDDRLTAVEVVIPKGFLLVMTDKGYGKRMDLSEFRTMGRTARGVAAIDLKALNVVGKIASARVVEKGDQITLISNAGIMLRVDADDVKKSGRVSRGVRVMNMDKGDRVASIGRISDSKKE